MTTPRSALVGGTGWPVSRPPGLPPLPGRSGARGSGAGAGRPGARPALTSAQQTRLRLVCSLVVLVGVLGGLLATVVLPHVYGARVQVLLNLGDTSSSTALADTTLTTQALLITSAEVLAPVSTRTSVPINYLTANVTATVVPNTNPGTLDDNVPNSEVIQIQVNHPDRSSGVVIANEVAKQYLQDRRRPQRSVAGPDRQCPATVGQPVDRPEHRAGPAGADHRTAEPAHREYQRWQPGQPRRPGLLDVLGGLPEHVDHRGYRSHGRHPGCCADRPAFDTGLDEALIQPFTREDARVVRIGATTVREGDSISIDGSTGEVLLGEVAVVASQVETYIEDGLEAATDGVDGETEDLVRAVDQLLWHADLRRRLGVRADEQQRVASVLRTPSRVDAKTIEHIEAVLWHCARQDETLGPQAVLNTVLTQRDPGPRAGARMPARPAPSRMLSAQSEASRLAGWLSFDLNRFDNAGYYYEDAYALTHEAQNIGLGAFVLCEMSHLATWQGRPRFGIDHAVAAGQWAHRTDDLLLRAYTADIAARAYAADGQRDACLTALDTAHTTLTAASDQIPSLLSTYDEAMLHIAHRGLCHLELREGQPAVEYTQQSLESLDQSHVREIAFANAHLGMAYAQRKEIDEAARLLGDAGDIAARNSSARLTERLHQGRAMLQPWKHTTAVRQLDDRLASYRT